MKIFNLQSKISLAIWSIILGLIINFITFLNSHKGYPITCVGGSSCGGGGEFIGWPFNYQITLNITLPFIMNLIFWVFVVIIFLIVIRHLKQKNM